MAVNGLEKITDKILAEARERADRIVAAAQAECDKIAADYAAKAESIRETMTAAAEQNVKDSITRAKASAATSKRNQLLAAQSDVIDEVFASAHRGVRNLLPEKYTEVLAGLLAAAFLEQMETERVSLELYGEEDAAIPQTYEVLMNQRDRALFGEPVIEAARKKLANKVPAEKLSRITLAEDVAVIDGGLILRFGDIESNCSLSLIFAGLRSELEAEVSHALFDARGQE